MTRRQRRAAYQERLAERLARQPEDKCWEQRAEAIEAAIDLSVARTTEIAQRWVEEALARPSSLRIAPAYSPLEVA